VSNSLPSDPQQDAPGCAGESRNTRRGPTCRKCNRRLDRAEPVYFARRFVLGKTRRGPAVEWSRCARAASPSRTSSRTTRSVRAVRDAFTRARADVV